MILCGNQEKDLGVLSFLVSRASHCTVQYLILSTGWDISLGNSHALVRATRPTLQLPHATWSTQIANSIGWYEYVDCVVGKLFACFQMARRSSREDLAGSK